MAYVHDGNAELIAQPLDIVEDLGPARYIQRSQRFIHEQNARLGEQGAADRHPLLFSTRQSLGLPAQQRAQAEELDDPRRFYEAFVRGAQALPIEQIRFHVQVRKEQCILKDIANPALFRRQVDALYGIEQEQIIDANATPAGLRYSCDCVDHRALARTRAAEQTYDRRLCRKPDLEVKGPEPLLDVNGYHRLATARSGE